MIADIDRARFLVAAARNAGRAALTESDSKAVLACFGLRSPRRAVLAPGEPATPALAGFAPPYVLKVVAPSILHKSEFGGVCLGLTDLAALHTEIDAMARRLASHKIEGWLVEETIPPGVEMVLGGTIDPSFGPTVMAGLGGILVELFADVRFGICPITRGDAQRLLDGLRGVRLLRGWRGAARADEAGLLDALLCIGGEGGMMTVLADLVTELDVNPLIVSRHGAMAADARILLRPHHAA